MPDMIKNKEFKTKNDWVDQLLLAECSAIRVVKRMVGGKEQEIHERDGVDVERLHSFARENGFEPKVSSKANPGTHRMVIGNAMRARARRRHGLIVNGSFIQASDSFCEGHPKKENPDGSKYESPEAKAKREKIEKAMEAKAKAASGHGAALEDAKKRANEVMVAQKAVDNNKDDTGAVKALKTAQKFAAAADDKLKKAAAALDAAKEAVKEARA